MDARHRLIVCVNAVYDPPALDRLLMSASLWTREEAVQASIAELCQ